MSETIKRADTPNALREYLAHKATVDKTLKIDGNDIRH